MQILQMHDRVQATPTVSNINKPKLTASMFAVPATQVRKHLLCEGQPALQRLASLGVKQRAFQAASVKLLLIHAEEITSKLVSSNKPLGEEKKKI